MFSCLQVYFAIPKAKTLKIFHIITQQCIQMQAISTEGDFLENDELLHCYEEIPTLILLMFCL